MTDARRPSLRRLAVALVLAGAVGGCSVMAPPSHRYFQPDPAQIGPYANSFGEAVIPRHGLIVVQGDDLAYGVGRGRSRYDINGAGEGQAAMTISQSLRQVLGGQVLVENRGFPDDTVATSAERWDGRPAGNLLILCYGYGDMHAHTAPDAFVVGLRRLIRAAHAQGATVFVVLAPPFSDPLMSSEQALYRNLAAGVAQQEGAEVFDAAAAMARVKVAPWKYIAQRPSVYAAIAGDMAPYIKVVASEGSALPQTGQAGSGESRTVRVTPASAS